MSKLTQKQQALQVIQKHPGLTIAQIGEHLEIYDDKHVRMLLTGLLDAGYISRRPIVSPKGKDTFVYHSNIDEAV